MILGEAFGAGGTALGAGVSAGTVAEAAGCAMVALAVPWTSVPAAVVGQAWAGRIVVEVTNALLLPDPSAGAPRWPHIQRDRGRARSGRRLVKAGNTLPAELLGADPRDEGGRRIIFLSGDDASAKATWRSCSLPPVGAENSSGPVTCGFA